MKPNRTIERTDRHSEAAGAARGGAIGFAGAAVSSLMGFVLTVVLARALGDTGAGVVLQSIAVFTIAQSVARLGMDTTAVWLLPRLSEGDPGQLRSAATALLIPAALAGIAAAAMMWWVVPQLPGLGDDVASAIVIVCWLLPCGTVLMVALGGTRGVGGIVPYTLILNIALPTVRPVAVIVAVSLSGGALAAAFAWAAPLPLAMLGALIVLWTRIRRIERSHRARSDATPEGLHRRIWGFALPRTASSGLEQSLVWIDVVLVGVIAGAGAAGVYGTASRFVTAGLIVATAMRIVVAPRFSALLERGAVDEVQDLYSTTTTWIILFGTPIYLGFAMFSPTILRWFGPQFDVGATALTVLSVGSIVVLMAGNVQSVLLMSGHSGWAAVNKTIVLIVNVLGNLVLVPMIGILGAAISWSLSMVIDTCLAAVQVRHFVGVRQPGVALYALAVAVACTTVPCMVVLATIGQGNISILVAAVCSGLLLSAACAVLRDRFGLDMVVHLIPHRRKNGGNASAHDL